MTRLEKDNEKEKTEENAEGCLETLIDLSKLIKSEAADLFINFLLNLRQLAARLISH